MLLGIFSDTHLGFGSDERNQESFDRFKEAIKIFKEKKTDFILHCGDLFNDSVPDQETWLKTFNCFEENNGDFRKIKKVKSGEEKTIAVKGIPIIAIHGTHEFRGKDFANALEILEKSNCLCHIHAGYALLEKNGEKVFVHGMSGVPEKFAKSVLEKYGPKPVSGYSNILLLHQSFTEFLPFGDDSIATLSLSDLPNGFDIIINGHLHWVDEQKIGEKRFLLTGSTIYTQMKKLENKKGKGVFTYDTNTKELSFIPFEKQRKLFYEKSKFENASPEEVKKVVEEKIEKILSQDFFLKPLIRIKVTGTLAKGFSQKDISFSLPEEKAIFSITKDFETIAFEKKINSLKKMQESKKSIAEFGINILEKNVLEANLQDFDVRRIFELLSEDDTEKAQKILLE